MKKLSGAIVWFLLFSLILSLGASPPLAQASPQGEISPLNPAFEQKLQEIKAPAWQKEGKQSNLGYFPSPLDWSHLRGKRILSSIQSPFPSSYDLRTLGKMPPVRNQGSYGTCWAFATFGSLESALLPSESWNFSEDNLVNTSGFDPDPYDGGGNYDMATAYLARWGGPVREDQDPYPTPGFVSFPPSKHVQEVLYLPPRSGPLDNDTIKSALMSYGGVYTSIYWQDSYYNPQKYSYYYSGSELSNHAVVIVGWNDDYSASNFSNTPPGNGAFIMRNSWGPYFGENGYFYVSYYDARIGGDLAVFNNAEPTDNYTSIYQYDPLGWTASYGYWSNTAWFANRFSAQSDEFLAAVSFYTPTWDSSFEIYVYDSFNGSSFEGLRGSKSGIISSPGYHTVALDSAISLAGGDDFCIVVKLTTPGYNYPVPLELPIPNYSNQATAHSGESYVSSNGSTWEDITDRYPNTNVCLKAFTKGGSPPSPNVTVISPNGGENWTVGESRTIQWSSSGVSGDVRIELSRDGGSSWETLFSSTANDGSQSWTVSGAESSNCRVKIISLGDPSIFDISNSSFTISAAPPPAIIAVVSPNGGEVWSVGENRTIQWTSSGVSGNVRVRLNRNYPEGSWETLFSTTANDGSQAWTVSGQPSSRCRIKVSSVSNPSVFDISDENFTINQGHVVNITNGPFASPSTISSGGTTNLSVNAVDSQGHAISYNWSVFSSSIGNGSFSDVNAQNPTWTAPQNSTGSAQVVVLKVRVSCALDESKFAEGTVNVTVEPLAGSIVVVDPNGGEKWTIGENYTIHWTSSGVSGDVKIELSRNGGSSWETLFSSTANDGSQPWTVSGAESALCRVRISSLNDPSVSDISDGNFTIQRAPSGFTFHLRQNWNMISLPLVTPTSPSTIFGGLPSGWRIFSWDPTLPGYRMNEQVTLEVGEGYWLKSPSTLEYTVEGIPFSGELTIPLTAGWHMIGSPYLEEVSFSQVRILSGGASYTLEEAGSRGIIGRYLFLWDGSQYQIANTVGKFEPGKGYWMRARQECSLVFGEGDGPPPPPGTP